jgi:hypothetical protein
MKKESTKSSADNSFMKVHPRGSLAALLAALATLEPLEEAFPNVDEGLLSLDDVEI